MEDDFKKECQNSEEANNKEETNRQENYINYENIINQDISNNFLNKNHECIKDIKNIDLGDIKLRLKELQYAKRKIESKIKNDVVLNFQAIRQITFNDDPFYFEISKGKMKEYKLTGRFLYKISENISLEMSQHGFLHYLKCQMENINKDIENLLYEVKNIKLKYCE